MPTLLHRLASLAFCRAALEKRCQRHGAPAPKTYRKASQSILHQTVEKAHQALATHHKAWENFLWENLV